VIIHGNQFSSFAKPLISYQNKTNYNSSLPAKVLQLNLSQDEVADSGKGKRQLKTNISTKGSTSVLGNWSSEPYLGHSSNHTGDTEAEGSDGSDSGWKGLGVCVVFWVVRVHGLAEDKVLSERDAFVDGEPVSDEIHEVLEDALEVRVSWDGDGDVDTGCDSDPDEARDLLGPSSENLEGEGDAVDVWDVVADDGEGEDDEAELAESSEWVEEDGGEKTTGSRCGVSVGVLVDSSVGGSGSVDGCTKELGEEEWEDETGKDGEEETGAVGSLWLVDSVVGSVAGPASSDTVDDGAK